MSESSQDHQQIILSLLNSHNEWKEIPDILHLTIKAISDYIFSIQDKSEHQLGFVLEKIQQQNLLINEQQFRLKDFDLKLVSKVNKRQMDKSLESIAKQNIMRNENESSFTSNFIEKSYVREGLDKTMIQEVKTITDAIIDKKTSNIERDIRRQIEEISMKIDNVGKISDHVEKINKEMGKQHEKVENFKKKIDSKLTEMKNDLIAKVNSDQKIVLDFMKENFISSTILEDRIKETEIFIHESVENEIKIVKNDVERKLQDKLKQQSDKVMTRKMSSSKLQQNKQLSEFKHKINQQLTNFIKISEIQPIIGRFHHQMMEKVQKNIRKISQIEEKVQTISKGEINNFYKQTQKQTKKDENQFKVLQSQKSLKSITTSLSRLQGYFEKKLEETKKMISDKFASEVEKNNEKMKKKLDQRVKYCCDVLEENCQNVKQNSDTPLKSIVMKLSEQMVVARFLHFGDRQIKDVVIWDKEVVNMMEQNYKCKPGQSTISVNSGGLYKIQVGLYKDAEIDELNCYLMLNGEAICRFKGKQLTKNSKNQSRGATFSEAILLPSKSKLSVRVEKVFYGQAYIQIHKL